MFKCKECGTEYQIKPDYCDCGNDTFEEIVLEQAKTEEVAQVEVKQEIPVQKPVEISQEQIKTTVKKVSSIEPYAIIIFAVCIILSIIVILFVANPKPQTDTLTKETQKTEITNIPSIDKLWNNSTEGISDYQNNGKKEKAIEQSIQTKTEELKNDNSKKKVEVKSTPIKQEVKKAVATTQKTTDKPQKTKTQATQNVTAPVTSKAVTSKANPQELANYKIKLRNYIASKIAFTTVVGDGECSFSFKISSSGVLTNKATVKLSDNDSLNEAVYNALRQVYSYNAPPADYKNETLKLIVRMYNNSFEVYLN